MLTADPRLVPEARTIPEISYREATELAYFGAKVLHPKTLRAVAQAAFPSGFGTAFAPEQTGTKITPEGPQQRRRRESADGHQGRDADQSRRTGNRRRAGRGGPDIFHHGGSARERAADFAVILAERYLLYRRLRRTPSAPSRLCARNSRRTWRTKKWNTSPSTRISQSWPSSARTCAAPRASRAACSIALGRENVNIIAIAQGSSESNISFVVAEKDMKTALVSDAPGIRAGRVGCLTNRSVKVS